MLQPGVPSLGGTRAIALDHGRFAPTAGVRLIQSRGKERGMPYIKIQVTREGVSSEQKAELIRGATDLVVRVLGKDPASTFVVIEEVDTDNWGVGGRPVSELRRARGGSAS